MMALSRLLGRWLGHLLDSGRNGTVLQRLARVLLAAALVIFAAAIVFLRINYNLSLGPR